MIPAVHPRGTDVGGLLRYLFGPGTEAAEARVYNPGDDVRRIDWSVTARTHETHVRDAVAERELETTLVVDLTASMSFGTVNCEKRDIALAYGKSGSPPTIPPNSPGGFWANWPCRPRRGRGAPKSWRRMSRRASASRRWPTR